MGMTELIFNLDIVMHSSYQTAWFTHCRLLRLGCDAKRRSIITVDQPIVLQASCNFFSLSLKIPVSLVDEIYEGVRYSGAKPKVLYLAMWLLICECIEMNLYPLTANSRQIHCTCCIFGSTYNNIVLHRSVTELQ